VKTNLGAFENER